MRFSTHFCLVEDTDDLIETYAEVRRYTHSRPLGQWSVNITREFRAIARIDTNCVKEVRAFIKTHFGGRKCLRVVEGKVTQGRIPVERKAFRLK